MSKKNQYRALYCFNLLVRLSLVMGITPYYMDSLVSVVTVILVSGFLIVPAIRDCVRTEANTLCDDTIGGIWFETACMVVIFMILITTAATLQEVPLSITRTWSSVEFLQYIALPVLQTCALYSLGFLGLTWATQKQ